LLNYFMSQALQRSKSGTPLINGFTE